MGSSMEAIYSGSDQSWNLASRFLSVEVVLLTLVWSQESSRECGSNMDIILDIFDIIFTLLSQCYKQNSISVYYLRQKLSFYLKCQCFGQSVHKKKLLCHFIFMRMHHFLLCFTAFITQLHGIFSQSLKRLLLWVSKYWPETIFISHQLFSPPHQSLTLFMSLSLHVCPFLSLFVFYKQLEDEWIAVLLTRVWWTADPVCTLQETCWRSSEGKASSHQVSSIPESGCRWKPADGDDGCERGQREIKAGFSFKCQMWLCAEYLLRNPRLNYGRPRYRTKRK